MAYIRSLYFKVFTVFNKKRTNFKNHHATRCAHGYMRGTTIFHLIPIYYVETTCIYLAQIEYAISLSKQIDHLACYTTIVSNNDHRKTLKIGNISFSQKFDQR